MSYRLKKVFPEAKIILGIRSQASYIESNYKEYIIHGGKMGFDKFLFNSFLCNQCLFPKLNYDKVIDHYKNLFQEGIFTYIHDSLVVDPQKELGEMFSFLGIKNEIDYKNEKVYSGISKSSAEIIRLVNNFIAKDFIEQYYYVGVSSRFSNTEKFRRKFIAAIRKTDFLLKGIFRAKSYLKERHIKYINGSLADSNKRLCEMFNRDLSKLGFATNGRE